jgi:lipase maturation factor 1
MPSFRTMALVSSRRIGKLFFRLLGGIHWVAFRSLRAQVLALYGARGLTPIQARLQALEAAYGPRRFIRAPSVFWWGASDGTLVRCCRLGEGLGLLLLGGGPAGPLTVALGTLYLSFVSVGGTFLAYQWDALLLETTWHAALAAPGMRRGRLPDKSGTFLMRWLLFRLYFGSGLAKLQSGDETWRNLTALTVFYETAPLPTRAGWWAHQLPRPVQRASTAATLAVELALPFALMGPRPLRLLAFGGFSAFQALIALTGNYAFFNLLSAALGLWALDDELLTNRGRPQRARRPTLGLALREAAMTVAFLASLPTLRSMYSSPSRRGRMLDRLLEHLQPFRAVNRYGLFSSMTTRRPELVVEGSNDGVQWLEYRFRYKPGALDIPPRLVAPHQPRLDWQMWFAALGAPSPWLRTLVRRLLEGDPALLSLLAHNPFSERPARFVRILLYDYRMTSRAERRRLGTYWTREPLGLYWPAAHLPTHRPSTEEPFAPM